SDGRDGSGRSMTEVAHGLRSHADGGVSVSSLGIGIDYDPDVLTALADAGRGSYAYLATGQELDGFLDRELRLASRTVVDQVVATLELPPGIRVTRSIGAEFEGFGASARLPIGAMHAGEERRVTLVLRVEPSSVGDVRALDAAVQYRSVADQSRRSLSPGRVALASVATSEEARASRNPVLFSELSARVIDAEQAVATLAWRGGDKARA